MTAFDENDLRPSLSKLYCAVELEYVFDCVQLTVPTVTFLKLSTFNARFDVEDAPHAPSPFLPMFPLALIFVKMRGVTPTPPRHG